MNWRRVEFLQADHEEASLEQMMWANLALILILAVVWGIIQYQVSRRIKQLQSI